MKNTEQPQQSQARKSNKSSAKQSIAKNRLKKGLKEGSRTAATPGSTAPIPHLLGRTSARGRNPYPQA
eukprot:scaffold146590_cov9-Tisochrysis_lutea.AAC.1